MHERRHSPRFQIEWPVVVKDRDGQAYPTRVCDISSLGIGLHLPEAAARALAEGGSVITPGDPLQVCLAAGGDVLHRAVECDCRVRHVRRLSRDSYLVGALFVDDTPDACDAVAALIAHARETGLKAGAPNS